MMTTMNLQENHSPRPLTVCVYCGSRPGHDPAHAALAREVGHWIGAHGAQLVYGGGHHGLMGAVADAALAAGARVIGVIPEALVSSEVANSDCSELIVVPDMHRQKKRGESLLQVLLMLAGIGAIAALTSLGHAH